MVSLIDKIIHEEAIQRKSGAFQCGTCSFFVDMTEATRTRVMVAERVFDPGEEEMVKMIALEFRLYDGSGEKNM